MSVVITASIIVGVMALVLPPLHETSGVLPHLLIFGWPPALLVSRVCCAVHHGAIRRRITTRLSLFGPEKRRWGLAIRDPEIVRRSDSPERFQLYVLFELGITVVVFLMFVGGAFAPLFRLFAAAFGLSEP